GRCSARALERVPRSGRREDAGTQQRRGVWINHTRRNLVAWEWRPLHNSRIRATRAVREKNTGGDLGGRRNVDCLGAGAKITAIRRRKRHGLGGAEAALN